MDDPRLQVEGGKLRLYSPEAYASWGSPKPDSSAVGDCGPGSTTHNCPAGAPMPNIARTCTNTLGTDCAAGVGLMAGQLTGCCPCRKTDVATTLYSSATVDTAYGLGPDCSSSGTSLPKAVTLQYSGAKVTLTAPTNGCLPGDYAMVVVVVSSDRHWALKFGNAPY